MSKQRIALVVQRYGEEVNGGAELLARWLAERLTALAEMHVITTCAIDYHTWDNAYPSGESDLNGVCVHRFLVDAPRKEDFAERTLALFDGERTLFDELQWMKDQGPYSTGLLDYIRESYHDYDLFIFVTYLYPPTVFGLPLVSDKAILLPMAHDEPYLRLPIIRPLFHLPQAIVYNTEPEMRLVNRIAHNEYVTQIVAGVGINVPENVSAERFRRKYGLDGPFVVYAGRVDSSKNLPELLDYFARFRDEGGLDVKLVLIGRLNLDLPDRPDIISLGFVSEQDKFDAIQAAEALLTPSLYESLSMVIMEAWLMGTPTLVNGRCEVLKSQTRRGNGGLYYYNYDEFAVALKMLLEADDLREQLGRQGRAFVMSNYNWDIVMAKYQALLDKLTMRPAQKRAGERVLHQFTEAISVGDAVSDQVFIIQRWLREMGFTSEIYAEHIRPGLEGRARPAREYRQQPAETCLIHHHAIGSDIAERVQDIGLPQILIYHNITPPRFFTPDPVMAASLNKGRRQLEEMRSRTLLALGDSGYNERELVEIGFSPTGVLPIALDENQFDVATNEALAAECDRDRPLILFVGRFAPNKRQEDLLKLLYHLRRISPRARMVLVGSTDFTEYMAWQKERAQDLGLDESAVQFTGHVSHQDMLTYYRCADVYISMSEHEGFGKPLIESMYSGLPVIAYASSAVPDTLGDAGILFHTKDFEALAELVDVVVKDEPLRQRIIARQKERVQTFLEPQVRQRWEAYLRSVGLLPD